MPQINIEQDVLDEIINQVYRRWCDEFDLMKKVKAETNDGSPDWQLFHDARIKNSTATLAKWNDLRLKLSPLHSLTAALKDIET